MNNSETTGQFPSLIHIPNWTDKTPNWTDKTVIFRGNKENTESYLGFIQHAVVTVNKTDATALAKECRTHSAECSSLKSLIELIDFWAYICRFSTY